MDNLKIQSRSTFTECRNNPQVQDELICTETTTVMDQDRNKTIEKREFTKKMGEEERNFSFSDFFFDGLRFEKDRYNRIVDEYIDRTKNLSGHIEHHIRENAIPQTSNFFGKIWNSENRGNGPKKGTGYNDDDIHDI